MRGERSEWAYSHGLEPFDGTYLQELCARPLTLRQLGEALAIFGQTTEMVEVAVGRLQLLGFVQPVGEDLRKHLPLHEAIRVELTAALRDLEVVLAGFENNEPLDGRTASAALRVAMSRVMAARRFLQLSSETD